MTESDQSPGAPDREAALREAIRLFQSLPADERQALAEGLVRARWRDGEYLMASEPFPVHLPDRNGELFMLTVHLAANGDGRVMCAGIDLHGFIDDPTDPQPMHELTATRLRKLALGDYVTRAVREAQDRIDARLEVGGLTPLEREGFERLADDGPKGEAKGRPAALTLEELELLVARPYRTGGRTPIVNVRRSLERSGRLGHPVTERQARAQVERARRRGLLPAKATSKKETEQ